MQKLVKLNNRNFGKSIYSAIKAKYLLHFRVEKGFYEKEDQKFEKHLSFSFSYMFCIFIHVFIDSEHNLSL